MTVLCKLTSTPISVFNLFKRYGLFSKYEAGAGIVRLATTAIVAWVHPTLEAFALVILIVQLAAQIGQFIVAGHVLKAEGVPVSFRWALSWERSKLDRSFRKKFLLSAFQSSLSGTVRIVSFHGVMLGVGAVLGSVAAAHYKVVQTLGAVLVRLANPIVHSTYPEFVTASRKKQFGQVHKLIHTLDRLLAILAAIATAAFYISGEWMLRTFFGQEFLVVFWPMLAFLVLSFWGLSNATVIPRLWAVERHKDVLWMQLFASSAHILALALFGAAFELPGVVASFAVYHAVYRGLGVFFLNRQEKASFSHKNTVTQTVSEERATSQPMNQTSPNNEAA